MDSDEILISAGWKQVGSQPSKYGPIRYWDHPDHQKEDGRWHTTGEAKTIQSELDRQWKTRSRHEGKLRHG